MSGGTVFNESRTYLGLVKFEADSLDDAEATLNGALSYAQASGNLPTTYEVLCAVRDDDEAEAIVEALNDDDSDV